MSIMSTKNLVDLSGQFEFLLMYNLDISKRQLRMRLTNLKIKIFPSFPKKELI